MFNEELFFNEKICSMKVENLEKRLEVFHNFLLSKDQNSIVILMNNFENGRKYGHLYTKTNLNKIIVIYRQSIALGVKTDVMEGLMEKQEYAGFFVEETGKYYGELYLLIGNRNKYETEWYGEDMSYFAKEFKALCESKILQELLSNYKSIEDIPDSLLEDPIEENEITSTNWKRHFFNNEGFQFTFEIDKEKFTRTDVLGFIINSEKAVNDFTSKYDKSLILRKLKTYYLAKKALKEFIPSEQDCIKKEIFQAINKVKDSTKSIRLYILGRDENRANQMKESIEGVIIECKYPIDRIDIRSNFTFSEYTATNWSVKADTYQYKQPIKNILFEDIVKISVNRKNIYEKK